MKDAFDGLALKKFFKTASVVLKNTFKAWLGMKGEVANTPIINSNFRISVQTYIFYLPYNLRAL